MIKLYVLTLSQKGKKLKLSWDEAIIENELKVIAVIKANDHNDCMSLVMNSNYYDSDKYALYFHHYGLPYADDCQYL